MNDYTSTEPSQGQSSDKSHEDNGKPRDEAKKQHDGRSVRPIVDEHKVWRPCVLNSRIWLLKHTSEIKHDLFLRTIFVDGKPAKDELFIHLALLIEQEKRVPWPEKYVRSAVIDIANEHAFNPLQDWLNSLVWDTEPRIFTFFEDGYGCARTPYAMECARVLFLQAVARALSPGCQADVMVVLVGPQGIFKSTGMAALCPFPEWFAEDVGGEISNPKSTGEGLQGKWFVEWSELARMTDRTVETIKSVVSRRVDRYRPSYGRFAEDFPRTCSFIGSTNNEHFLRDTENRRFMPISVKQGVISWIAATRDQLWAEAVHRYNAGEKWWTASPDLIETCKRKQKAAVFPDAWEEILEEKLGERAVTTVIQAAQMLGLWDDTPGDKFHKTPVNKLDKGAEIRIGHALRNLGFKPRQVRDGEERSRIYEKTVTELDTVTVRDRS